ncbi:MAG: hypothetical protein SF066_15900 [Thermoanaerobaculia bacterium]|nr:hypothetical protein [Thermoanaerobaculia bacterium]
MSGWRGALAGFLVLVSGGLGERVGAQVLTPGTVELELAGEGCPTTLSAHWASLEATLCGSSAGRGGGAEDCRLTAGEKSALDPDGLTLSVLPNFLPELCGSTTVPVTATELRLRGKGLRTVCGTWSWTFELMPKVAQPVSRVTLLPLPQDPVSGVTSGTLDLAGRLRFVHDTTRREVRLPWNVSLDLVASWRLDETIREGSNLQLFTDSAGLAAPGCVSEVKKCSRWQLRPVER